jgi:hypothetical protein
MRPIPQTEHALVLRTDFSDDEAWRELADATEPPPAIGWSDTRCATTSVPRSFGAARASRPPGYSLATRSWT